MKKKELKEAFVTLTKRVDGIQRDLAIATETIDFLCNYNKDEVVFTYGHFKFIYDGEIRRVGIFEENSDYIDIVENKPRYFYIRVIVGFSARRYYKIDKANGNIMDITDIYHEKVEGETQATAKPTEEKCDCKCKKGGKK